MPKRDRDNRKTLEEMMEDGLMAITDATKKLADGITQSGSFAKSNQQVQDHDLLIALNTTMNDMKKDVKEIKEGTSVTISDHEKRIRSNEKNITQIMTYGAAAVVALGVLEFIINKFLPIAK